MKKAVILTIAALIVLVMAMGFFWNMVPGIISSKLSKSMGVPVQILSLSRPPQDIKVKGVTIQNPAGSILKKALTIQSMNTDMSYFDLLDKKIVIDNVDLNNVYLGLEFNSQFSSHGNWTTIMSNLDHSNKSSPNTSKSSKAVLIKTLTIRNLKIDLIYKSDPKKVIHLKPIQHLVIRNVGSDNGNLAEQLTQIILHEMLKNVFSEENLTNMLERIINTPASSWKDIFKELVNPQDN